MNLNFLTESNIYIYLFIFFGKIFEVTIATVRMVLINRGEKKKGSIVAFFEAVIWIFVTGTVLAGFKDDLIKVALYCVSFAIGNYLGSWLEAKLAIGLNTIQVITPDDQTGLELTKILREDGLGVTLIDSEGKQGKKKLLLVHLQRSRVPKTLKIIKEYAPGSVVTASDVRSLRGGFIKK